MLVGKIAQIEFDRGRDSPRVKFCILRWTVAKLENLNLVKFQFAYKLTNCQNLSW